jgi:hypothetical protein
VIYEPVLLAKTDDGGIYLEVDKDAYRKAGDPMATAQELAQRYGLTNEIDWNKVRAVIQNQEGIAVNVALHQDGSGTAYAYEPPPITDTVTPSITQAPVTLAPATSPDQAPATPQAPVIYGPETSPQAPTYSYYAPGNP